MRTILLLLLLNQFGNLFSQGLMINEFSNGSGGTKEYIELLVVPNPSFPCANVNVSGWIIDDNNGDFEGVKSGVGIAPGHFRIKSGCYTNLTPGSILLIYNANDKFAGIPANDPTDSNGDKVYIIPHTSTCIEVSTGFPSSTSGSYTPATYVATTLTGTTSWDAIGMANSGDAVQVRKPDYSFFHGFSYGDVGTPFPTFPAQLGGGSSFNIATGSGSGFSYVYNCGGITGTNYSRIAAASGTPGSSNSTSNLNFINNLKNCTIDWTNLSNANNCNIALDPIWLKLNIDNSENEIHLEWESTLEGTFNIQAFENEWNTIEFNKPNFANFHSNASLFRIQNIDFNGNINFSPVIELKNNQIEIYPNPFQNTLQINANQEFKINISNLQGQIIDTFHGKIGNNEINTQNYSNGIYFYQIPELNQQGKILKN